MEEEYGCAWEKEPALFCEVDRREALWAWGIVFW